MDNELTDVQKTELTSGGSTDLHYHPFVATHDTLEKIQAVSKVVEVIDDYHMLGVEDIILANPAGAAINIYTPLPADKREYIIINTSSTYGVTVNFSFGALLYFTTGAVSLPNQGDRIRIKAHNYSWIGI